MYWKSFSTFAGNSVTASNFRVIDIENELLKSWKTLEFCLFPSHKALENSTEII